MNRLLNIVSYLYIVAYFLLTDLARAKIVATVGIGMWFVILAAFWFSLYMVGFVVGRSGGIRFRSLNILLLLFGLFLLLADPAVADRLAIYHLEWLWLLAVASIFLFIWRESQGKSMDAGK